MFVLSYFCLMLFLEKEVMKMSPDKKSADMLLFFHGQCGTSAVFVQSTASHVLRI